MVHKSNPQTPPKTQTETAYQPASFFYELYDQINFDSVSEYSSSSEFQFFCSTDLIYRNARQKKRTNPALMAAIPGPEAQLDEVRGLWGSHASDPLSKFLNELDDLFMNYKADIGKCEIAKHPVEVEPGAVPHREGARRMSSDKAERANQEVCD